MRIWDEEGREYIDADSGAISVISIGHGVEEIVEAMADQARRLAYVHNGQFENVPAEELATALAAFAPGDLNRSTFASGGSEAIETAVKLVRHYHLLRGKGDKEVVISRERSYHGATLLALGLSGTPARQEPYVTYFSGNRKIAAPYSYRLLPDAEDGSPDELAALIEDIGPDQVSAFVAEPIGAAAAPGLTPPPGYFERIREICDEFDVIFIADEVVTGMGRTGENFGIEHWDAVPDVIVTAKGLAGGYLPLSAVIFADEIAATFEDAGTSFMHGLTYESHPLACATGLAVLTIIERDDLVANAATRGAHLKELLLELAERHEVIGDVRGMGLLLGLELVADRASREPLPRALDFAGRFHLAAQERGVMIYPGAPPHDGSSDQVLITPPLTVSAADVEEIVARLDQALTDLRPVLAQVST